MGILSDIRNILMRRDSNNNAMNNSINSADLQVDTLDKESVSITNIGIDSDNIEEVDNERKELLNKIDKDKFNELCNKYFKDESYFSNFFLKLLSNNSFIDELCNSYFVSYDLLDSINNNKYNINSIDKYNRFLFKYLPFNDRDKEIIDMTNRRVNLRDENYYMVSSNHIDNIGNNKEIIEDKIASLFPGIEIITDKREVLPINDNFYEESLIKIINPVKDNKIFRYNNNLYCDGEFIIDENTIIIVNYDKFIELSKNKDFINKYSKACIVFDDDYNLLSDINTRIPYINNSYDKNNDDVNILSNHLLYIINNSNLNDDRKEYYRYSISDLFYSNNEYGVYFKLESIAKNILSECGIDYIKNITNEFNKLSIEEKNKDIEKVKFNYNMFINSINNYDNISVVSLLNRINTLTKENKELILNDERIKSKIRNNILNESNSDEWGYYRNLFSNGLIDIDYFFSIVDGDMIDEYYSNNRYKYAYKLFGSICEVDCNKLIDACIKDIELFKLFYKDMCDNSFDLSKISYDNIINIIKLINSINGNDYSFIRGINIKYQYFLLKEDFDDNVLGNIVNNCGREVIQFFVDNDKRLERVYKKINIINNYNHIKLSPAFLHKHSKYIFDMLYDRSLVSYRYNIDRFNRDNASLELLDRFDRYEDEIINSYDEDKEIFPYYMDKINSDNLYGRKNYLDIYPFYLDENYDLRNLDGKIDFFKKVSILKLSEVVVDRLFKDNIYNVHLNIGEMLRYNSFLDDKEKVLDDNSIKFYNNILNISNMNGKDIVDLYNSVRDKNIDIMYYDDITSLKNKSYDNIKDVLFSPHDNKDKISNELSNEYGVDIYDFRDNEYTMLVRCLNDKYREETPNKRDCYTLISDLNSKVLYEDSYIYGYSNFSNDCVLHIFEGDAFSTDTYDNSNKASSTKVVNRIMTPEQIIMSDSNISEVQILNKKDNDSKKYNSMKPDFICVYDNINDKVLEEARRLNIPIVIIKDNKLKYGLRGDISYDRIVDDYVLDYGGELNRRNNRK